MVKEILTSVVRRFDNVFCAMAHFAAPMVSSTCRGERMYLFRMKVYRESIVKSVLFIW